MFEDKYLLTTNELKQYLNCERKKAVKIGELAHAKVSCFGRVFKWNKKKIEAYIDDLEE